LFPTDKTTEVEAVLLQETAQWLAWVPGVAQKNVLGWEIGALHWISIGRERKNQDAKGSLGAIKN
jgi:hypothetical protein